MNNNQRCLTLPHYLPLLRFLPFLLFLVFALFLGLLSGCGKQTKRVDSNSKIEVQTQTKYSIESRGPGVWEETLTGAGPNNSDVRFAISVPDNFDKEAGAPLVFSLHFGGPVKPYTGKAMMEGLVEPALKELGAVIVAPDSIRGGWQGKDNKAAIKALHQAVMDAYSIDAERTVVTGYSMGGEGAFHYGIHHPELFRLAVPVAGFPGVKNEGAELKTAFYIIHSNKDTVVQIDPAKKFAEAQKANGADITFVELDDLTHYQTMDYATPLSKAVPWIKERWDIK